MIRTLAITLLAAAALPAAAHAAGDTATFKVSAYGVQRYTNAWTENEDTRPLPCGDRRGPISEGTVVRFKTTEPTLMRATRSGHSITLAYKKSGDDALLGTGDWEHTYDDGSTYWDCQLKTAVPAPPEPTGDCDEGGVSIQLSFESLSLKAGRTRMNGGVYVPPIDPFPGCTHGDFSMDIYPAKGRLPDDLFEADRTEVTLRGSEHDEYTSDAPNMGIGGWRKKVTLYLVFKRVR